MNVRRSPRLVALCLGAKGSLERMSQCGREIILKAHEASLYPSIDENTKFHFQHEPRELVSFETSLEQQPIDIRKH